ncbi:unnamed protein product [Lactuca saligna]|uniref:Uncharacterized protein n=1 Tax=Lactuca saligna TaxID=75948 RepID=A0AA35ZLL5_LACSI|nr:unnamed protein product [Lactuca saligna]
MVETRDSILTVSVFQHLTEKLRPVFTLLNRVEGVPEGKEKMIDDSEEVLSEGEMLVRKKRDKKSLFPPWTLELIQKEAIDGPNTHWLEANVSFELVNSFESQFDFPLTPNGFLFCGLKHIEKAPLSDYDINNKLFAFYLQHGQTQGATRTEFDLTLVDLSFMNPNDWISLFLIQSIDEAKYEPIVSHLKKMMICYIHEVAKHDVEIVAVLKKRYVVDPKEETKYFQKRKLGKLKKADWSVIYQRRSGDKVQMNLFFLLDKHLYPSSALNHIMELTVACKLNSEGHLKCFNVSIDQEFFDKFDAQAIQA